MRRNLPAIPKPREASGDRGALWLRLTAFLASRSPNTRATYLGIIKEWCTFLGADMGTEEAARRVVGAEDLHAAAYRTWLESRPGEKPRFRSGMKSKSREIATSRRVTREKKTGLEATQANATIWKKFAALRRIYRALISYDFPIKHNPFDTDRVAPPPKESGRKRPTEMLDFSVVKKVLSIPNVSNPKGLRDRAILSALFGGGLRRSEVAGLRVGDVRRSAGGTAFLYLRSTKAKRDAEQALPPWAAKDILAVVDQRKKEGAREGDFLFVSYRGRGGLVATNEPVSHSGIYRLFKECCLKAGAGAFLSPHSARATAITKLLDDGLSHREVQEFSRHSSIQMVELYDKRRIGVDESPAKGLKFTDS